MAEQVLLIRANDAIFINVRPLERDNGIARSLDFVVGAQWRSEPGTEARFHRGWRLSPGIINKTTCIISKKSTFKERSALRTLRGSTP
jgi:hypothetical protein